MSSEKAREREVHKYYQAWLESSVGYNASASTDSTRFHADKSRLRPSKDKALIAFAQLGCLRLNAKRGIICLLSTQRQYVLAEATQTLSLIPDISDKHQLDELWFGNASFPRHEGISEAALTAPDHSVSSDDDGLSYTCPALVINDVAEHETYKSRGFAGRGVSFYCGVPIISQSGFVIGVYNVTDDKPRDGLSRKELMFLHDMASIVMDHFETVKNDAARFRGEKMVIGIGRFIQGASSVQRSERPGQQKTPSPDRVQTQDVTLGEDYEPRVFKGLTITDADPHLLRPLTASFQPSSTSIETSHKIKSKTKPTEETGQLQSEDAELQAKPQDLAIREQVHGSEDIDTAAAEQPVPKTTSVHTIFSRAANILRECASADGVLFLDAVSANLAKRSSAMALRRQSTDSDVDFIEEPNKEDHGHRADGALASHENTSAGSTGSEESDSGSRSRERDGRCQLLGYSMDISAHSSANQDTMSNLSITERTLRRLIRRYPHGKIFYFSPEGTLSSSDKDSTYSSGSASASTKQTMARALQGRTSNMIATELMRIVPGARNVVWLPLWDFSKQRWSAGTFLWSRRPERLVGAQDDLVYLKSFANSIMVEVARVDAALVDTAKSTFISNISHELRSPLHGILGSIELLQETKLDGFQSQLVSAVDLCGKTLVDTVDHVLDYAKINHLSRRDRKNKSSNQLDSIKGSGDGDKLSSSLEDEFDLATMVEEVVDVVYAGSTSKSDTYQDGRSTPTSGSKSTSSLPLQIVLDLEHQGSWRVQSQPGAIRRVLMNIFGNALKYTQKGSIKVSLHLVPSRRRTERVPAMNVAIMVADTGRGMSADFIRNHAFTPFTQESQFSVGTGLGLSIVQQIVDSLGGKINLKSEKGTGTTIKIQMTLPVASSSNSEHADESLTHELVHTTSKKRLCIVTAVHDETTHQSDLNASKDFVTALENLAKNWLDMQVFTAKTTQGVLADFFIYPIRPSMDQLHNSDNVITIKAVIPTIVVTSSAREGAAFVRDCEHQLHGESTIIEVISQPIGPQKLSRVLSTCLRRLEDFKKISEDQLRKGVASVGFNHSLSTTTMTGSQPSDLSDGAFDHFMDDPRRSHHDINNTARPQLAKAQSLVESDVPESDPDTSMPGAASNCEVYDQDRLRSDPPSESSSPPLRQQNKVLLVDDNEINLKLLQAFMRKGKHSFETATNGLEALEAYQRASDDSEIAFTHVFMDVSMPVMDGIQATHEIRQFERKLNKTPVRIFALTGVASDSAQRDIMNAGADVFVAKPLKMAQLLKLLDEDSSDSSKSG